MIAEEKINEIRQAARISEFISPHVELKRKGRSLMGLCPFHSEKTASFSVNDDGGFFHCFGCGMGGNVFKFLMELESLSFPEAVRKVAAHYGIDVPDEQGAPVKGRDALYATNASAQRYFSRLLLQAPEGEPVRDYLRSRGVSKSAVETYGLGAAPVSGKGLTAWFEREAIDGGDAVKLGLLGEKEGRRYDRFRGRLMFPIRDIQGRTLGFGGRSGESAAGPKYLNSPESEIYRKSRALYGVYEGRQALREAERAVVVEGYLDVIALHEAGIEAVVASCGTALTVEQARLLKRFSSEVVVLFDGDDAGMAAAARSFPVFVEAGVWAYGAFLPRGEDPDSYVRTHGAAKMLAVIKNAAPLAESYVRRLGSGSGIADSARAAAELASVLKKVSDPFEHDLLVRKAAMWTGVSEQLLRSRGRPERSATPVPVGSGSGGAAGSEELLATVLLADPGLAAQVDEAEALRSMQDATWRDIVARTIEAAPGGKVDAGEMLAGLSKTLRDRVAGRLAEGAVADPSMRQRVLTDCVKSIQAQARRRHNLDLVSKMRKREQLDPDRDLPEELAEWKPREGCDA